jgi:hypothetical protein
MMNLTSKCTEVLTFEIVFFGQEIYGRCTHLIPIPVDKMTVIHRVSSVQQAILDRGQARTTARFVRGIHVCMYVCTIRINVYVCMYVT